MQELLILTFIFFLAGFVQGVTGFGAGLLAMPLLAFYLDIKVAVPLCTLNGLVITAFLSVMLKNHIDFKKIMPLAIGCLPGVVVGVGLLKNVNENVLAALLGLLISGYAGYRLVGKIRPRPLHQAWAYLAGFGTGAISGAFSAGGPPTIIYTTLTGWSKDEIKATLSGFFFITGVTTVIGHVLSGLTTFLVLRSFSVTIWGVAFGVYLGSYLSRRFSTEGYLNLILSCLFFLGLFMFVSAFGLGSIFDHK
ncbi:MAG: sulfite exporter TauE/SafE family protein [Desulfobulbaceae bacterium]|nr:sulfite exporter TauE/SafE family protein [Desulfobulbaceae bacterium]